MKLAGMMIWSLRATKIRIAHPLNTVVIGPLLQLLATSARPVTGVRPLTMASTVECASHPGPMLLAARDLTASRRPQLTAGLAANRKNKR